MGDRQLRRDARTGAPTSIPGGLGAAVSRAGTRAYIDLIAHEAGTPKRVSIRLRTRWQIDRRYRGRDIRIASPDTRLRHRVAQAQMIRGGTARGNTVTRWWRDTGQYLTPSVNRQMRAACQVYAYGTQCARRT